MKTKRRKRGILRERKKRLKLMEICSAAVEKLTLDDVYFL